MCPTLMKSRSHKLASTQNKRGWMLQEFVVLLIINMQKKFQNSVFIRVDNLSRGDLHRYRGPTGSGAALVYRSKVQHIFSQQMRIHYLAAS